jgi:DNA-binding HxlR family transcriptional regulator
MLTQGLKTLEAHGFLERRDYAEVPPRVDYRLTPLGESLRAAVATVDQWVLQNFWTVADACDARGHTVGTVQPAGRARSE